MQRQFDIRALQDELAGIERAVVEVSDYVTDLLERQRREPGDDAASALLAAEAGGERLTHAECVNLVVNELAEALTFPAPRMPRLGPGRGAAPGRGRGHLRRREPPAALGVMPGAA